MSYGMREVPLHITEHAANELSSRLRDQAVNHHKIEAGDVVIFVHANIDTATFERAYRHVASNMTTADLIGHLVHANFDPLHT
jgi:hypothetical protein